MSKLAELAYDIEQMYIEGYRPGTIAAMLECDSELVYTWLEQNGLEKYDAPEACYVMDCPD